MATGRNDYDLAVKLQKRREALGMTRDALAAASGVSRETIRKIEQDAYEPGTLTIGKLERALAAAEEAGDLFERIKRLEAQVAELSELVRRAIGGRR